MIRTKLPTKLKDFPRAFSYLMHQTCKRRAALASRRLLPHHPPSTQSPSCSKTSATPTHLPDVLTVMRHPVPELPWPEQSPPWKFTCAGEQPLSASDVPAPIYLLLKIWPLSMYPYQGLYFHTGYFYTSASVSLLPSNHKEAHQHKRGKLKEEIYGRREERKTL